MIEGQPHHKKKIRNWGTILKFSLVRGTSGFGWSMIDSLMTLYFFYRFDIGSDVLGPVLAVIRFISMFTYLLVPRVVETVSKVNKTGNHGDGKIFVLPVDNAHRVRTGEQGIGVLDI